MARTAERVHSTPPKEEQEIPANDREPVPGQDVSLELPVITVREHVPFGEKPQMPRGRDFKGKTKDEIKREKVAARLRINAYEHARKQEIRRREELQEQATQGGFFSPGFRINKNLGRVETPPDRSDTEAYAAYVKRIKARQYRTRRVERKDHIVSGGFLDLAVQAHSKRRRTQSLEVRPSFWNFSWAKKLFSIASLGRIALGSLAVLPTVGNLSVASSRAAELAGFSDTSERTSNQNERHDAKPDMGPVQAETRMLAGDPESPFAALIAASSTGSITVPNSYLQLPGAGLHAQVTLTADTEIVVRPVQHIRRWWDAKQGNPETNAGPEGDFLTHQITTDLTQGIEDGTIRRTDLDSQLRRSMGLDGHPGTIESITRRGHFNWHKFGEDRHMNVEDLELVRDLATHIDTGMVYSIFFTELIGGRNTETSMALVNHRLQTGGEPSLMTEPAQGDHFVAMGWSQATTIVGGGGDIQQMSRYLNDSIYGELRLPTVFGADSSRYDITGETPYLTYIPYDRLSRRSVALEVVYVVLNDISNLARIVQSDPNARRTLVTINEAINHGTTEQREDAQELLAQILGAAHNHRRGAVEAAAQYNVQRGRHGVQLSNYITDEDVKGLNYRDYADRVENVYADLRDYTNAMQLEHSAKLRWGG